jgi:hypothetical protein
MIRVQVFLDDGKYVLGIDRNRTFFFYHIASALGVYFFARAGSKVVSAADSGQTYAFR